MGLSGGDGTLMRAYGIVDRSGALSMEEIVEMWLQYKDYIENTKHGRTQRRRTRK